MKKIILALFAAMFAACASDVTEDVAITVKTPETLRVAFEEDSRIQLQNNKTVWTKGDLVSVFYKSNANQKWEYRGETGARVADLYCIDSGIATATTNSVMVVYPYNADYVYSLSTGNIEAVLPTTQHYLKDSYGIGDNLMVSQSEFTQFSLKSVCGWLKVQISGNGEKVKSITLKGNNNEQVAGLIYVDTSTAKATLASQSGSADDDSSVGGNLVFEDNIYKTVTLDCDKGVALGSTATAFYIAIPPQSFEKGLSIDIEAIDGTRMVKSTNSTVVIERNTIQPMTSFSYVGVVPEIYDIAYTTNDGQPLDPFTTDGFGSNFVENKYDATTGKGVLEFDGKITAIPQKAFYACENLTTIDLPIGITSIGVSSFNGCTSLLAMNIPQGVTTLSGSAFYNCNAMTEITIPNSVTSIGNRTFYNCSSIIEITIPNSVTSIGSNSFEGCSGKAYICCKLSDYSFAISKFTEVILSENITALGNYAFLRSAALKSVSIPDSITKIGIEAFSGCSSLESIVIPDSVTSIGKGAFLGCSNLKSVKLPEGISTLGDSFFSGCKSLTSIDIPESVTSLGNDAFRSCSGLKNVIIPKNVKSMGFNTFSYCSNLESVVIGRSVTSIGKNTFKYCSSLTDIKIGNSVTSIGGEAFLQCTALKNITIPDGINTIEEKAFQYCSSLESITIPNSVTKIRSYAFYGCNNLASVSFGKSVTSIEAWAFCDCNNLTSINIPDNITSASDGVFSGCDNLKSITFSNNLTSIAGSFCKGCPSLEEVVIPEGVTSIGSYAFDGCTMLEIVTIPESVTKIDRNAFMNCNSLSKVYCKPTTPPSIFYITSGDTGKIFPFNQDMKICVPRSSYDAYVQFSSAASNGLAQSNWYIYQSYIEPYDF